MRDRNRDSSLRHAMGDPGLDAKSVASVHFHGRRHVLAATGGVPDAAEETLGIRIDVGLCPIVLGELNRIGVLRGAMATIAIIRKDELYIIIVAG